MFGTSFSENRNTLFSGGSCAVGMSREGRIKQHKCAQVDADEIRRLASEAQEKKERLWCCVGRGPTQVAGKFGSQAL